MCEATAHALVDAADDSVTEDSAPDDEATAKDDTEAFARSCTGRHSSWVTANRRSSGPSSTTRR